MIASRRVFLPLPACDAYSPESALARLAMGATHPPATQDPSEEGMGIVPLLGGVARRAGVGAVSHHTFPLGEGWSEGVLRNRL